MASLFRVTVTRFYDSDGRQCSSKTPGARRKREKSKTWNGEYRGADGKKVRVSLETRDKSEARKKIDKLEERAKRESNEDFHPSEEHRDRPLLVHLEEFKASLQSKGDCARHVKLTARQIGVVFDACGFKFIRNVSASAVMQFLSDKRKPYTVMIGKKEKQRKGIGPATLNSYLVACKSFTNWLLKERRATEDRLSHLSRINAKTDVRRERRALTADEFQKIVTAAEKSSTSFRGLNGSDRAMLYRVAALTGLRASELASLTPGSFDLNSAMPTVTVEAGYSKRRNRDTLPLHADLLSRLREWLADRLKPATREPGVLSLPNASPQFNELLWPGNWAERGADMLRRDLKAADVPYLTEAGFADFHSLRHSYITNLVAAGVHPKTAQVLARHSTITLTMDRYSHVGLMDMNAALQSLPSMQKNPASQGTGTNG